MPTDKETLASVCFFTEFDAMRNAHVHFVQVTIYFYRTGTYYRYSVDPNSNVADKK